MPFWDRFVLVLTSSRGNFFFWLRFASDLVVFGLGL